MSTTPRTDEQVFDWTTEDGSDIVHASFARQLETELAAITDRAEEAEFECQEQARLLGMSGQREAALLGKIEQLERELAKAKATIEDICTGSRLTCDQCLETMPCNCGHSPRRL
jgi:hypothetical protein